jgi:hypothetical protein
MFWHPLSLAIISTDIVALFLLLAAGITSFRTASHWQPFSADSRQLTLAAKVQTASIQGRSAFGIFLFSGLLLVFGIANVLHEDIPGAMCGTGVYQAMAGSGPKLLLYKGFLILLLQFWYELDKLNRMQVDMPLSEMNARVFLLAPPVAILALIQTVEAFSGIHPPRPVDCCTILFDQFRTLQHARSIAGLEDPWWIGAFIVLSVLLVGLSAAMHFSAADRKKVRVALLTIILLWLPVATLTLVNVLAVYHYGVSHHHCPWCLFLPQHGLVGYPLYGSMLLIGMESSTIITLPRMVKKKPYLYRQALDRCRRAGRRITIAAMIFLMFAAIPPIVWRLRYGVWLAG